MGTDANFITYLVEFITPVLIGVLSYFLKGILQAIRKIEQDLAQFRAEYAGHMEVLKEHKERLEKIESKLDQNDRDLKLFYLEYGSSIKKN